MKISIIIPNWNGEEKIINNMPVILKTARKNRVEEVIVIDDASTDNSVKAIQEYKDIKLIEKKENTGFSSTVNLGVKNSAGDIIILLNSDTQPGEGFIDPAVRHFQDSDVFSVGCNVGGLWSGAKFEKGYFWHNQAQKNDKKEMSHLTLWASGGSGFFRKAIWDELGGFDELYDPFYEEDVDLGYRAVKRGYINIWESQSLVSHYKERGVIKQNFSSKKVAYIAQRNQLMFIWKNITSKNLINQNKLAVLKMIIQHPTYSSVVLAALTKLPQILKKRKVEERYQKLTDEEILDNFKYN